LKPKATKKRDYRLKKRIYRFKRTGTVDADIGEKLAGDFSESFLIEDVSRRKWGKNSPASHCKARTR